MLLALIEKTVLNDLESNFFFAGGSISLCVSDLSRRRGKIDDCDLNVIYDLKFTIFDALMGE